MNFDSCANWCLSGGADGADLEWGKRAANLGHGVIHFSFAKHRTKASPEQVVILRRDQLVSADPHCILANERLQRQFPTTSSYVNNLLRRDWFQVAEAQSCYAVSSFSNCKMRLTIPLGTVLPDLQVKGGTAWAVSMFINRHNRAACACYLFDQERCHWFRWQGDGWECIYHPPVPSGVWAGIGSRKLNPLGKLAIRVLLEVEKKTNMQSIA